MLKAKQLKFIQAVRSGKFDYLCAAGTAGTGKTFVTLGLLHLLCCNISGLRFAVFRKSEKNLRQTSIPSYEAMKRKSKSVNDSYMLDMTAKYPKTGSEIMFVWADSTKDPDLNNIRGLELTGCLFEEANQIDARYFHLAKIRVGRWNNHKCKKFIMLNLNPSIGWVKDLFYDPWSSSSLPPRYYFEEFSEDDITLGEDYKQGLADLPEEEYKRFVKNRWDYSDIPNQLIKYEWYKQCVIESYQIKSTDRSILAIDPAWEGDDDTVFGRMHGTHIGGWEAYPKQDPDVSGTLGYERAKEYGILEGDLIVDPIGVGAATALKLRNDHKFEPDLFIAGAAPENTFGMLEMFNKRSEAHWLLREAMRLNEITIEHTPGFQKQCLALKYSIDEKKFRVRPKNEIKKEIHESPGYVDVATMLIHKFKTTTSALTGELMSRQNERYVKVQAMSRAQMERAKLIRQSRMEV